MKEYIKQGFGIGIGYLLGTALLSTAAKVINDAIQKHYEKVDQSDSSTEEGEA